MNEPNFTLVDSIITTGLLFWNVWNLFTLIDWYREYKHKKHCQKLLNDLLS